MYAWHMLSKLNLLILYTNQSCILLERKLKKLAFLFIVYFMLISHLSLSAFNVYSQEKHYVDEKSNL